MCEITKRTISELVIFFGFSKRNAEIVIEMLHDGLLTNLEEEVIKYIQQATPENYPAKWFIGADCNVRLLEHLNYRITQMGGDARTPDRRRRIC